MLALLLSSVALTTQPAAAASFQVPTSIDATGTSDVSNDLLAFFATVPDGTAKGVSLIVFPPNARYRIEGSLVLRNRRRLTFVGNGAEFFAVTTGAGTVAWHEKPETWPQNRSHWVVFGGSFITFDGVQVRGPNVSATYNPYLALQAGFEVNHATDVSVTNCQVVNVHGEFVIVNNGSARVLVSGCNLSGAGRQGLGVNHGEDVQFAGNRLERVARSAVNLEPALDWNIRRVTVTNNDFYAPVGHYVFANGGAGAVMEDITWTGNRAHGLAFTVKSGAEVRRARYTFSGNRSDTIATGTAPVRFHQIDGIVIHDNVIPAAAFALDLKGAIQNTGCWLEFQSVTGVDLAGNDGGAGQVCVIP